MLEFNTKLTETGSFTTAYLPLRWSRKYEKI